jgi:DNA-binding IclR family transcriptional regulator
MNRKSAAPALERGIRVLKYLEGKDPVSLDSIARATGYPKSSLLRVLDTLINQDVADKDISTGL